LFRRSDRRDDAPDERTLAARDAATQGFLALDDEQRAAADAVRAADELGGAKRLGDAWAQVAAVGDRATEAYLTATQEFPLDGSRPTRGARAADERALREIEAAREAIRRFRSAHSRTLDEAAFVLTTLPGALREAQTALVDARAAVQRADASGVRSRRASERLAEAEQTAVLLDGAGTGLRERRTLAQRALELARSATTLAAEAPRTAATVRSALTSVATRRDAAATKAGRIGSTMSALRREFSEPSSHDLIHAERTVEEAIAAADRAVATARRQADTGDWDDASDSVTAARSALSRAEEQYEAVTDRLAQLREVRADPAKVAADTRFVLRDAQRLVVDRGLVAEFGQVLDAQAVRLENTRERLTGVHPDYWLYLTEMRGIRDRVKDVVSRARSTRAR
jgi:hypothetical protein